MTDTETLSGIVQIRSIWQFVSKSCVDFDAGLLFSTQHKTQVAHNSCWKHNAF
jgi:hypothetical protein